MANGDCPSGQVCGYGHGCVTSDFGLCTTPLPGYNCNSEPPFPSGGDAPPCDVAPVPTPAFGQSARMIL